MHVFMHRGDGYKGKRTSAESQGSHDAYSAFILALFTEMYGFPLTINLLSGWLSSKFPGVDFFAHDSGHLLKVMFGWGCSLFC